MKKILFLLLLITQISFAQFITQGGKYLKYNYRPSHESGMFMEFDADSAVSGAGMNCRDLSGNVNDLYSSGTPLVEYDSTIGHDVFSLDGNTTDRSMQVDLKDNLPPPVCMAMVLRVDSQDTYSYGWGEKTFLSGIGQYGYKIMLGWNDSTGVWLWMAGADWHAHIWIHVTYGWHIFVLKYIDNQSQGSCTPCNGTLPFWTPTCGHSQIWIDGVNVTAGNDMCGLAYTKKFYIGKTIGADCSTCERYKGKFPYLAGWRSDLSDAAIGRISVYLNDRFSINNGSNLIAIGDTICNGTVATLTATGNNTYTWSNSATGNSITVNPTTTTTYTVTGTIMGFTHTAQAICNVISISLIASTDSIIKGDTATLTASGGTTYTWSVGGSGSAITVSPTTNTTYTVTGTSLATNCTATAFVRMIPFVCTPDSQYCAAPCSNATTSATAGMDSYTWSNGATTQGITVSPTVNITYTVTGSFSGVTQTARSVITCTLPFSPATLTNVVAWWRADSLWNDTTIGGNANKVWVDITGNSGGVGRVYGLGAGGAIPSRVTNQLNGQSVIRFDGDDKLVGSSNMLNVGTGNVTILIVGKSTTNNGAFLAKLGSNPHYGIYYYSDGNLYYDYNDGSDRSAFGSHAYNSYEVVWAVTNRSVPSNYIYYNATQLDATACSASADVTNSNDFRIGSYNGARIFLTGDIAEIIITKSVLTATEKTNLDTYLYDRYGLNIE